ncbi:MAG: hypothetical protein KBF37_07645 [Saprospiraceae bacterium]|jgi:hypothetical protein|nr:hypothetical protein [Saprospiraceae bacterium]MBP9210177.1 hypothetical protein [Saprospiraceae bacterium]MBV6473476.1 hypothetical protein [Saprospiraceae bacterium]
MKILRGLWRLPVNLLLLWLLFTAFACRKAGTPPAGVGSAENELPADFASFYAKFHADSAYQLSHIDFPLRGLPDGADVEDPDVADYFYTADQWSMHRLFDPKLFETRFLILADMLIEERIKDRRQGWMIIRRYARDSEGWKLIYYAGVNNYRSRTE